uniref:RRM domain-containing protein n=1 Tax=Lutzomyia longipalpis TaxID=7200 RepID=A0A1B0CR17_LUTLO
MSDQSPDGQYYDDTLNYKSISCEQIPEQFLDKVVAKEHFSQFGVIKGFILRPKRYECTVYYETEEAAENALMDGGVFNNYEFRVFYTPKETPKPKIIEENIDPDVQAELEAMGSVPIVRTFPQIREKIEKIERKPFPVDIADGKKIGPLPNTATKAEIKAILRKPALTTEDK